MYAGHTLQNECISLFVPRHEYHPAGHSHLVKHYPRRQQG